MVPSFQMQHESDVNELPENPESKITLQYSRPGSWLKKKKKKKKKKIWGEVSEKNLSANKTGDTFLAVTSREF